LVNDDNLIKEKIGKVVSNDIDVNNVLSSDDKEQFYKI